MQLHLVTLDNLLLISEGASAVDGLEFSEDSLPPSFLTDYSLVRLRSGHLPVWNSYFLFTEGGRALGSGGFKGDPFEGQVEIGYGVSPQEQGRGVATKATGMLLDLAFTYPEVTHVTAETSVVNPASRSVIQKNGFDHVGQRDTKDDGLVDRWSKSRSKHIGDLPK